MKKLVYAAATGALVLTGTGATAIAVASPAHAAFVAPMAIHVGDVHVSTPKNTEAEINLFANFTDPDDTGIGQDYANLLTPGGSVASNGVVTVAGGTFQQDSPRSALFTPAKNFEGKASVKFRITDTLGRTADATAVVTVGSGVPTSGPTSTAPTSTPTSTKPTSKPTSTPTSTKPTSKPTSTQTVIAPPVTQKPIPPVVTKTTTTHKPVPTSKTSSSKATYTGGPVKPTLHTWKTSTPNVTKIQSGSDSDSGVNVGLIAAGAIAVVGATGAGSLIAKRKGWLSRGDH